MDAKPKHTLFTPSLPEIKAFDLTRLADQNWSSKKHAKFNHKVVDDIYNTELNPSSFASEKLLLLELSQYLEKYLWLNYDATSSSKAHTLSIVLMVNEKFRARVSPWEAFTAAPENFSFFFNNVLEASLSPNISLQERRFLLEFMTHCFGSLENKMVEEECKRIFSLSMWHTLAYADQRERIFAEYPQLLRLWRHLEKKFAASTPSQQEKLIFERSWLSEMIKEFYGVLESIPLEGEVPEDSLRYCERFLEMLIDLEAQLPTRRYVNTILEDHQVVIYCRRSSLGQRNEAQCQLFNQLLHTLKFYTGFEIHEFTAASLTEEQMAQLHCRKIVELQRIAFVHFRSKLAELALANISSIDNREALTSYFSALDKKEIIRLCELVHVRTLKINSQAAVTAGETEGGIYEEPFLLETLINKYEKRESQLERINATSLYPDETIIFDDSIVTSQFYNGDRPLSLPKLNLQFLSIHDYLLRNFNLFRLESVYEIRQDIEDAVKRLGPRRTLEGVTTFGGWSRMACEIEKFNIIDIGKPHLGEKKPSRVKADVTFNIGRYTDSIKNEWDTLRPHDIVFFLTIEATMQSSSKCEDNTNFRPHFGLKYVRGGEISDIIGDDGKPIDEMTRRSGGRRKTNGGQIEMRTVRVMLDANQYQLDQTRQASKNSRDVYETFNVVMRRRPKENNFKAVLETIRDLMRSELVVPDWLHDVFLGYGDTGSAHYTRMPNRPRDLDFRDTFIDWAHLQHAFPNSVIKTVDDGSEPLPPPYVIEFSETPVSKAPAKQKKRKSAAVEEISEKTIRVKTYTPVKMGPYPSDQPPKNTVRFTPVQVEAITAGMNPGLTMVVGPPGTGKTDIAVQIIANLYNNHPDQHILLVTHSNQALNQLFEKIMALDIDQRHLLRLGHGEEELNTDESFSKAGRVNSFLERRQLLLVEVERLAKSLEIGGDHAHTCDTAGYFYVYHILSRWESYLGAVQENRGTVEQIIIDFPFTVFFANAPPPLFPSGIDYEEALEIAEGCFRHIRKIFTELDEIQAFELLRTNRDRADYLLTKEAKIVAMTCTHAALKRRDLVRLGFKYDTVVMEEAAQILEVETFIPLLLQEPEDGRNRLKRVVLIGDHHQLPPVVKNMAFQKYGNMEQSMFARFVRLGVPAVQLDSQGRARPSIAELYNWRYQTLGNLPSTLDNLEYKVANAGFAFDYQMVDVQDYMGTGESAPSPYFYQNLGEAEYVVAVYQYMRLLGYPAEKIAILTTYNGQKALIRDVLRQRCAWNPMFGQPSKVTTVDKYQGQQTDYILLSLVRTKSVGHIRDVRRLIVALSRARLGLYIFCRRSLFENCYELTPAFEKLAMRPDRLQITTGEMFPAERVVKDTSQSTEIVDVAHMGKYVHQMMQEQLKFVQNEEEKQQQQQQLDEKIKNEPKERIPRPDRHGNVVIDAEQLAEAMKSQGLAVDADVDMETDETDR